MRNAELFANLPLVARQELCRHFDPQQMMRLAMKNEKWEEAMGIVDKKTELFIIINEISLQIYIKVKKSVNVEDVNMFDMILQQEQEDPYEHLKFSNDRFEVKRCQFAGWREDEELCQRALRVVLKMFPSFRYDCIRFSICDPALADILLRFLNRLPSGSVEQLQMHSDIEIEGNRIIPFLERMKVEKTERYWTSTLYDYQLHFRIKNAMKAKQLFIDTLKVQMKDARMLTGKSMTTLTFEEGEFRENDLTSEDFNVFFRRLKEDEGMQNMTKASFKIGEHQNINLEEVLKGLDAKPWDPEVRDRWLIKYSNDATKPPIFTDFRGGLDFRNASGTLCSVAMIDGQLTYHKWNSPFAIDLYWRQMEQELSTLHGAVEQRKREREELRKQLDNKEEEVRYAELKLADAHAKLMDVELFLSAGNNKNQK